jgi:hypothetical protein
MNRKAYQLLPILAICWVPAHVGTIWYNDSGTFSSSTASSAFSGPGGAWSLSFQADTNPVALGYGNGGVSTEVILTVQSPTKGWNQNAARVARRGLLKTISA